MFGFLVFFHLIPHWHDFPGLSMHEFTSHGWAAPNVLLQFPQQHFLFDTVVSETAAPGFALNAPSAGYTANYCLLIKNLRLELDCHDITRLTVRIPFIPPPHPESQL